MTNNFEDFEQPGIEPGSGLPQTGGVRANLAHAWRTRPLFKLLVVMIVAGAILAVGLSLFSGPKQTDVAKLTNPPGNVKGRAGGSGTPYFNEQVKKSDAEQVNNAFKNGTDAMGTPVGRTPSVNDLDAQKPKTDPLVELRAQLDLLKNKVDHPQPQQQQQAQQGKPEPFDDSLSQAMQRQMKMLQDSWDAKGLKQVSGVKDDTKPTSTTVAGTTGPTEDTGEGNDNMPMSDASRSKKFATPIINAGTVSYAQLLTEANSDAPGPILAQILSGPLAGARAVGEFRVENEFLVIRFSLANLKGIDYHIDAIALDPDTTLGAMATEVDERLFTRVVLPAAASFISTFGSNLGQPPQTVVTNGDSTIITQSGHSFSQGIYSGIGQAGQTMGQFFQNQANQTQTLVKVAAGTPMGLFFTGTVCSGQGCALEMGDRGAVRGINGSTPNAMANTSSSQANFGYNNNAPNQATPGYNNGMQQGGYNSGNGYNNGNSNGYNNSQQSGTGITYNNSNNGTNLGAGSSPPPPMYNTTNPPPQQNGGLNVISGTPGIGTGGINP